MNVTATRIDRQAMSAVCRLIPVIRNQTQKHIDQHGPAGAFVSPWVFVQELIKLGKTTNRKFVTSARIQRLVQLGWLEEAASDGFGISVKIKSGT